MMVGCPWCVSVVWCGMCGLVWWVRLVLVCVVGVAFVPCRVLCVCGGGGGGDGGGSDAAVNERSLSITHHGMHRIMVSCPCGHDTLPCAHGPKKSTPTRSQCQRLLRGHRQGHHVRASCRMKRSKHLRSTPGLLNGNRHGKLCHCRQPKPARCR